MPQPSDRKPGEGQRVLVGQPKHLARTSRLAQTQARKGITGEESGQHSVAMVLCGGAGGGGAVRQSSEKYFSLPPACCATLGKSLNISEPFSLQEGST